MRMFHVCIMVFGIFLSYAKSLAAQVEGFVQREGSRLHVNGSSYYFHGANQYYLFYKSQKMTNEVLEDAASLGLNTLRTWAFCDGEWHDGHSLQPSPRQYNEASFKNLDYAIYRAEQLGIRLIFSLTNNWDAFGGMNAYVRWTRSAREHDDFYTNQEIKNLFKDYIRYVLNRRNTYTGRLYKEEPAILMWELANEPRIAKYRENSLYNWIDEMAGFIKSEDPNHLVSSGSEGDLDADLYQAHRSPSIDIVSFHLYPEDWNLNPERSLAYIERNIRIAKNDIKKPVYCGEFGLRNKASRESTYRAWYQKLQSLQVDGSLFWILSGKQDDGSLYPDYDGFTLYYPESGSILDLVKTHSSWTTQQSGKRLDFEPPTLQSINLEAQMTVQGDYEIKVEAFDQKELDSVLINFGGLERHLSRNDGSWTYLWKTTEFLDGPQDLTVTAVDAEGNTSFQKTQVTINNGLYKHGDWQLSGRKEQDDGYNFIYHLSAKNQTEKTEEGHFFVKFFLRQEGNLKIGAHYDESSVYQGHPSSSGLKVINSDVSALEIDLGWRKVEPGEILAFKGQITQDDGQFKSQNDWSASGLKEVVGQINEVQWFKDDQLIGGSQP